MTSIALPVGASFTVDDLEALPDGPRYELYDGMLVVTPAPDLRHQRAVLALAVALRTATAGSVFEVVVSPFEWRVSHRTEFQPDLIVAERARLEGNPKRLETPPTLAVEVLSPSTRSHDLGAKRIEFAAAGLEHYWVVDPDPPSVTVLRLDAATGEYVVAAEAMGADEVAVEQPFTITLRPADLIG